MCFGSHTQPFSPILHEFVFFYSKVGIQWDHDQTKSLELSKITHSKFEFFIHLLWDVLQIGR